MTKKTQEVKRLVGVCACDIPKSIPLRALWVVDSMIGK